MSRAKTAAGRTPKFKRMPRPRSTTIDDEATARSKPKAKAIPESSSSTPENDVPQSKLPAPSRVLVSDSVTVLEELGNRDTLNDADLGIITKLFLELKTGPTKSRLKEINDTLKQVYERKYRLLKK